MRNFKYVVCPLSAIYHQSPSVVNIASCEKRTTLTTAAAATAVLAECMCVRAARY